MQLNRKTRRQLRIHNIIYYLLLLSSAAVLAWLSVHYEVEVDWSAGNRSSLSPSSVEMIRQLQGPVTVTVFAGNDEASQILRENNSNLIHQYRRHKPDLELIFINPETSPGQARILGIRSTGEAIIEYQERQERLQFLNEETFTNALQRLSRTEERWIVFLSGHGEREPQGEQNFGLNEFTRHLTGKGFRVQTLNILTDQNIPDNTHILVLADPQTDYLPAEVKLITAYIEAGGNLLWLTEPGARLYGLQPLLQQLGITLLPGVVIDATAQVYGITQPDFALINEYPDIALTRNFKLTTLFPQAAALESADRNPLKFKIQAFLKTQASSWTETGPVEGTVQFDANSGERAGPLTLGFGLSRKPENARQKDAHEQRIVMVGDTDFLSNTFLGNGGNLQLGLNIFNWLSHDDQLINIKPVTAPDTQLELSPTSVIVILVFFLLLLPAALLLSGIVIWLKRRRR